MSDPAPVPSFACQLRGVHKAFGTVRAVDGLNLAVRRGELYAFLGPNGAGKTTSIRMLAGLLRPDQGEVEIEGVSMATQPEAAKRPMAYIPDDPLLYGKLRPLEFLEFVAALWSVPSAEAEKKSEHWLRHLSLWEKRDETIESFSRGMKQKLSLAAGLLHSPTLLLLDEPLTGLDASAARLVKDILLDFVREGKTVVLTTHILEVAERLAQRIGIIQAGRLIAEGSLDELRAQTGQDGRTLEEVFLQLTAAPVAPVAPEVPVVPPSPAP